LRNLGVTATIQAPLYPANSLAKGGIIATTGTLPARFRRAGWCVALQGGAKNIAKTHGIGENKNPAFGMLRIESTKRPFSWMRGALTLREDFSSSSS
jgi:hypothetical protein